MARARRWFSCSFVSLALFGVAWDAPSAANDAAQDAAAVSEPLAFAVSRKGTATVEDAYRLFLTMAIGHSRISTTRPVSEMDFDQVTGQLLSLGVIDPAWCFEGPMCLRRDVLAYMCASYMGCRPGLLTGICGMTRRYAHREMMYQRVIAAGPPGTFVSGSELLAVMTRVERRMEPRRDVQLTDDEIH